MQKIMDEMEQMGDRYDDMVVIEILIEVWYECSDEIDLLDEIYIFEQENQLIYEM